MEDVHDWLLIKKACTKRKKLWNITCASTSSFTIVFNESNTLDHVLYHLYALAQRFVHLLNSKSTQEL